MFISQTNTQYDLLDSHKLTRPAAELLVKDIEGRNEGYLFLF